MKQEPIVVQSGGVGICGATFLVFLVLKLIGVISWSWWWITAPLWAPIAIILAIAGVIFAIAGALTVLSKLCD
jgi:hypothetical protein